LLWLWPLPPLRQPLQHELPGRPLPLSLLLLLQPLLHLLGV
jgi:hypothetical protein